MNSSNPLQSGSGRGLLDAILAFCLRNKVVVLLFVVVVSLWGLMVAPFDWDLGGFPRDPVPVDAIPDIGENQQIVFSEWPGRSPQDVEDQISYPLTVSLLGIPGVKTIRSYSMLGFSTVYVIFEEDVEFYWSRSRVLEKLSSLPPGTVPDGVQPNLGPDATALGQVFWYTLEGRDENGNPTGGWDLHELRSIQDWQVRYALMSAKGVSEVASAGGFVKEYQIDVDPNAMLRFGVRLEEVMDAVRMSNLDVGARTIEINRAEYVIRGIGFVKTPEDIAQSVIKVRNNVPVTVAQIAHVTEGPALRRGALDKEGAEVVGGVVVVRYGENPLTAIKNIRRKIAELAPGLPRKTLVDGTISQVTIVPFYDRTGLIRETLDTLDRALTEEIMVTIIVVLIMVLHLRSSLLISALLPLAVLMSFIAMKEFGVDANIVALSGIAIAIGTMVDMGIVICENILKHLEEAGGDENPLQVVFRGASEVGSAVLTAVATTVVSFLPVFTLEAAEGKLFKPLAFTKTFALIAAMVIALTVIPPLAHMLFPLRLKLRQWRVGLGATLVLAGVVLGVAWSGLVGLPLSGVGIYHLVQAWSPAWLRKTTVWLANITLAAGVCWLLARHWAPLGPEQGINLNFLFTGGLIGGLLLLFLIFQRMYPFILQWFLKHKVLFLVLPVLILMLGLFTWLGFDAVMGKWLPESWRSNPGIVRLAHNFPGLGKEFMPDLDEGSFLLMPTTMPHASIGEVLDVLQKQDRAISGIPEVESVVGKLGRAESPLDPAPVSMIETVINYRPQFLLDESGHRRLFRHDPSATDYFRDISGELIIAVDGLAYLVDGKFQRGHQHQLIEDPDGIPFRLWRPALDPDLNGGRSAWSGIQSPDDIWDEILKAAKIPGTTSAPKLQPIAARIVMLQSGIRAPMGMKIKGPDLESIDRVGLELERLLKEVPRVEPTSVIADRIVGKPYLEIHIDRRAIARHGLMLSQVQNIIEVAVGGKRITTSVEGRERYPIRVRYLRELRDSIPALEKILVPAPDGTQIPLGQLTRIDYVRGPQMIKSEDTFLVGYVLFDKKPGNSEVEVVEQAREYIQQKLDLGEWELPAGVSYTFTGSYENQVRSEQKFKVVLPLALFIIFMLIYLQFKRVTVTLLIFTGVLVAWSGGFIMIWLYSQAWFLDISVAGTNLQTLFQVGPINLSVAVWVGFLALFGIATDDGVLMSTYLEQSFADKTPSSIQEIREWTVWAAQRRIRPALMTTATTILALIPVLTSTGRGADIMIPMAIPTFGGMTIAILTVFVVPVLYCGIREWNFRGGAWRQALGRIDFSRFLKRKPMIDLDLSSGERTEEDNFTIEPTEGE